LRPGLGYGEHVALGLATVAEFWEEDPGRAQLLLQGGPTFNSEAHLRLAEDLAEIIRREFPPIARGRTPPSPAVMATVILGLALEIGRIIVAEGARKARPTIEGTIEFARRAFGPAAVR
ncbi:MAG: hypothetical protein ACREQ9_23495, partial [Candidatus Binatia bacterium]